MQQPPVIEKLRAGILPVDKSEIAGAGDRKAISARGPDHQTHPIGDITRTPLEHVHADLQWSGDVRGGKGQPVQRGAAAESEQEIVTVRPSRLLNEGRIADLRVARGGIALECGGTGLAVREIEIVSLVAGLPVAV